MSARFRRGVAAIVITLTALVALVAAPSAGAASSPVPYSDPRASGYIGLCNAAGRQITSGSIDTTPFVVRAVSSTAAPSAYSVPGRTATLYGFQPRQGLPPGVWSGAVMTAAGRYTNPAHPMVAATPIDDSLADLLSDYPLGWDNLVQLRMYLGAPNEPADSVSYPTLNLKVTGRTWKVVGPSAKVDCMAGSVTSVETLLLPAAELRPSRTAGAKSTAVASSSAGTTAAAAGASAGPGGSVSSEQASATTHGAGGANVVEVISIIVLVLGLGALVRFWVRRRRDRTFLHRHFARTKS